MLSLKDAAAEVAVLESDEARAAADVPSVGRPRTERRRIAGDEGSADHEP
jgi:hypothetical protein